MKRITFITLVLLLTCFTSASLAVDVTIFGPMECARAKKGPTIYEQTFPGVEGDAWLVITNGGDDKNTRVSSAVVELNAEIVVTPNQFKKKVERLQVPINLHKDNTIKVTVNSKPGCYLTVEIIKELSGYESHTKPLDPEKINVDSETGIKFVNDQLLLIFALNTSEEEIQNIITGINGTVVGYVPIAKLYQIQLLYIPPPTPQELDELIDILETNPNLKSVSHNRIRSLLIADPNDPYPPDPNYPNDPVQWNQELPRGYNWGLEAIKMLSAWEVTKGGKDVKVGIVDGGFYLGHEDILGDPDIDPESITAVPSTDNILSNDSNTLDCPDGTTVTVAQSRNNHGTHILGIIGAGSNNTIGITGIMWQKDISVYRTENFDDPKIAAGIEELLLRGVQVINFSIGNSWADDCISCYSDDSHCPSSPSHDDWLKEERNYFESKMDGWLHSALDPETPIKDFLIVQAAGNDNIDSVWGGNFNTLIDQKYKDHIIVVGSISPPEQNGDKLIYHLSDFSNYGDLVDIVAPGGNYVPKYGIHSTVWSHPSSTGYQYATAPGTSLAAPFVTGVAGLVWNLAENNDVDLTASQVKQILVNTADDERNFIDERGCEYKILNAEAAVNVVLNVNFPDPNLEAAIREAINKPSGDIMYSELQVLTSLGASGRGIINLEGLQYCSNLNILVLHYNQISDISPLAGLTKLSNLVLGYNQISDISPLAGLTNLSDLYIDNNQISDISPLAGLVNLSLLAAWENEISDIGPLAGLTELYNLILGYNQIIDISPLSGLVNLSTLYIDNNQIIDIAPLSGMTSLIFLASWHNQISDISPLVGLVNLSHLDLGINQIGNIGPLVSNLGLGSGDSVWLSENPLDSTSCTLYIPELINRGLSVSHDCPFVIPTSSITVDGYIEDWSGINPAITDPSGDGGSRSGSDLKAIYLAKDSTNVYVRIDLWNGTPSNDLFYGVSFFPEIPDDGCKGKKFAFVNMPLFQSSADVYIDDVTCYHDVLATGDLAVMPNIIELSVPLNALDPPSRSYVTAWDDDGTVGGNIETTHSVIVEF